MPAMIIERVELLRYSLPFVETLHVANRDLVARSGLVVRVTGEGGAVGCGEIAPLPGYSLETFDDAVGQATALAESLEGQEIPQDTAALDGAFEGLFASRAAAGSVRFGFELAVLNLLAATQGLSLRRLLNPEAPDKVEVAGLLNGNLGEIRKKAENLKRDGYGAVKLKVGRYPLADDVHTTQWLSDFLGPEIRLRLDTNRAWAFGQAVQFVRDCFECHFDYIEEPLDEPARLKEYTATAPVSVALDESLRGVDPERLAPWTGLKALILKPTVLGLERAARFARRARSLGLVPVFSSCFESGFGLIALAELAAALAPENAYPGFDTYEWLAGDILEERPPLRSHTWDLALLDSYAGKFDDTRLMTLSHA